MGAQVCLCPWKTVRRKDAQSWSPGKMLDMSVEAMMRLVLFCLFHLLPVRWSWVALHL